MHKKVMFLFVVLLGCIESRGVYVEATQDYSLWHNQALEFCNREQYNTDFYFLVDLSIHSGKNRFFVYDFKSGIVADQGLVTHGSCDVFNDNPDKVNKVRYSNRDGSHCSSYGKYRIGKRDYSSWGINVKYWLHGLESTNLNAEKRVVVLHSWTAVADHEIYPRNAPMSWGCPAVSDNLMRKLDNRMIDSKKPVLLWIIDR